MSKDQTKYTTYWDQYGQETKEEPSQLLGYEPYVSIENENENENDSYLHMIHQTCPDQYRTKLRKWDPSILALGAVDSLSLFSHLYAVSLSQIQIVGSPSLSIDSVQMESSQAFLYTCEGFQPWMAPLKASQKTLMYCNNQSLFFWVVFADWTAVMHFYQHYYNSDDFLLESMDWTQFQHLDRDMKEYISRLIHRYLPDQSPELLIDFHPSKPYLLSKDLFDELHSSTEYSNKLLDVIKCYRKLIKLDIEEDQYLYPHDIHYPLDLFHIAIYHKLFSLEEMLSYCNVVDSIEEVDETEREDVLSFNKHIVQFNNHHTIATIKSSLPSKYIPLLTTKTISIMNQLLGSTL